MPTALELAQAKQRQMRASGVKIVPLDPVTKAARNPRSKTMAIAAMCYQCQGEDADPSWRWRIGNCEISDCALHPVRPHQKQFGATVPSFLRPR